MTAVAALVAGLATSLHCVGMCGPIACGAGALAKTPEERLAAASAYHAARLFAYGTIGALCGAIGRQPLKWFFDSPAVLLPWALVAALLVIGTGLDKKIPRPAFLNRFTARMRFRVQRLPVHAGAGAMGLLTPFLPCGPLYVIFGAALLTGSAAKGAEFTLAFGLGTVPLLWFAQHHFLRLRSKLTPRTLKRVQRGLAFAMAILLAWRLHDTLPPTSKPVATEKAAELPTCCH